MIRFPKFASALRCILVVALTVGILLPRMSAVLADIIPGVTQVAICTGSEIITLTIGPDGQPIETEIETSHCVLGDTSAMADGPDPVWVTLARSYHPLFISLIHDAADQDRLSRIAPSRAPPALI